MKPKYVMLTLLILGTQSSKNDIDVFLRPLIDELKELWVNGIDMHDVANDNIIFRMWAALLWMINDFPTRISLFE